MPRALISVDRRANGDFESNAHRVFPLLDAFGAAGWEVGLLSINRELAELEEAARAGAVFVLADTFASGSPGSEQWQPRHAFRDWLQLREIHFVGSDYAGMRCSSSCDKAISRRALTDAGLAVAPGVALRRGDPVDPAGVAAQVPGMVVVKQATATGGGVGVHMASTGEELAELLDWHQRIRGHDVIVEQFIPGREFTAWVIDRHGEPSCYGLIEIRKPRDMPILDQSARLRSTLVSAFSAEPEVPESVLEPALEDSVGEQLRATAVAAHEACGLRHYSRIDLILHDGIAFVLDVNAAPEIGEAGLGTVAAAHGDTLADVVVRLTLEALR